MSIPWVPEPQNLNEKKLVRGKERRKKGETFFPSLFFLFIIFGSGTQGIMSTTFLGVAKLNPCILTILFSQSLLETNFNVDSEFLYCFLNFCAIVL